MEKSATFQITTDNGKRFCDCVWENGQIRLLVKNGSLSFQDLIQQIYNSDFTDEVFGWKRSHKYR